MPKAFGLGDIQNFLDLPPPGHASAMDASAQATPPPRRRVRPGDECAAQCDWLSSPRGETSRLPIARALTPVAKAPGAGTLSANRQDLASSVNPPASRGSTYIPKSSPLPHRRFCRLARVGSLPRRDGRSGCLRDILTYLPSAARATHVRPRGSELGNKV